MDTDSVPKLRKRKAIAYAEEDDSESTPQKKLKPAAKISRAKTKNSDTKTKTVKRTKSVKKVVTNEDNEHFDEGDENLKSETKTKTVKHAKSVKKLVTSEHNEEFDEADENICTTANTVEDGHDDFNVWNEAEMLSQLEKIPLKVAQNLISLLSEGCTLPFIARYRKTAVDNLMPDR